MRLLWITATFLINSILFAAWEKVSTEVEPAIAVIMSSGRVCSASLIAENKILTAAHCVDTNRLVHINFDSLKKRKQYTGYVSAIDQRYDIAVVTTHQKVEGIKSLKLLTSDKEMKKGASIATIGHPTSTGVFANPAYSSSMSYLMSSGIVSKSGKKEIITDMSLSPGNSGGAVFNEDSEIVGVVSRKRADRFVGNIGILANHRTVSKLLKRDKSQKLPWYKSKGTGHFTLGVLVDDYLSDLKETYTDLDSSPLTLSLGFSVFDRVYLSYTTDVFDYDLDFSQTDLGYKFHFDMENQTSFFVGLAYTWVRHDLVGVGFDAKTGSGFKLNFQHSSFPLGLTYSSYDIDGEDYYNVGFVFNSVL